MREQGHTSQEVSAMYSMRKLKPDRSMIGMIPALVVLLAFGVTAAFFGLRAGFYVMAALVFVIALYVLVTFAKTRNRGYLISGLFVLSQGLFDVTFPGSFGSDGYRLHYLFLFCELFFGVWLVYLAINKRLKWRGREILELAAAPIEETGNGYTSRPLPTGKTEFSRREILALAEFAARNLIAVSYVQADRVVFVPVMSGKELGYMLGLRPHPDKETWVSIGFDGSVSVSISKDDYLTYREDLSFDQLCKSLGNLFIEFLELVKRGEGIRIVDRMDALSLSAFS